MPIDRLPVCICNNVGRCKIELAIKRGARTIEEVNDACGAGMSCGSCHYDIEKMIADSKTKR